MQKKVKHTMFGLNHGKTYTVSGMKCEHCAAHVKSAAESVEGAKKVSVDLKKGLLQVKGDAPSDKIIAAVKEAGYGCALQQ